MNMPNWKVLMNMHDFNIHLIHEHLKQISTNNNDNEFIAKINEIKDKTRKIKHDRVIFLNVWIESDKKILF